MIFHVVSPGADEVGANENVMGFVDVTV